MQVCAVTQVDAGSNPTSTCCELIWALERKIFLNNILSKIVLYYETNWWSEVFSIGKWEYVKAYADAPSDLSNPWIL